MALSDRCRRALIADVSLADRLKTEELEIDKRVLLIIWRPRLRIECQLTGGGMEKDCVAIRARVVHIVDDDELIRRTIRNMLADNTYRIFEYGDAESFFGQNSESTEGCILLDLRMPGMDGIQMLKRVRECGYGHPVVLLSGQADFPDVVEAMKCGASDFIQKPFRREVLNRVVGDAFRSINARRHTKSIARLTNRERQVIRGVSLGRSSKEIARELGISYRTVDIYRSSAIKKLGAHSSAQAVLIAKDGGVLD